jgi:hypothetical protein
LYPLGVNIALEQAIQNAYISIKKKPLEQANKWNTRIAAAEEIDYKIGEILLRFSCLGNSSLHGR